MITDFEEPGFVVPENASAGSGSFTAAEKRTNRTKMKAKEKGVIVDVPSQLAIPSIKEYQYGLSTVQQGLAHLLPRPLAEEYATLFQCSDWESGFESIKRGIEESYYCGSIEESEWLADRNSPSQIDITLLAAVYTIIVKRVDDMESEGVVFDDESNFDNLNDSGESGFFDRTIRIYAPSLLRMTGTTSNPSKEKVQSLITRLQKYQAYLGMLNNAEFTSITEGLYPVMPSLTYDQENNVIEIASPYLTRLAVAARLAARCQRGKTANTFCVNASLGKTKSVSAKEVTLALTTLIEQLGNRDGRIKAETVLNRCPTLLAGFSKASTCCQKDHILKRAFGTAYKLMQTETQLLKKHPNLKLPTDDMIPTSTQLCKVINILQAQQKKNNTRTHHRNS